MEPQEEIIRLLVLQVRLQTEYQTEAIRELSKAGLGPARIAELIGTTPGSVATTMTKIKKRAGKSGKKDDLGEDSGSPAKRRKDRSTEHGAG